MIKFFSNPPWNKPNILPWIILVFAAINEIFLGGKRRAFGSFIAHLHKDFKDISLMELNWIGDSYAAMGYILSSASTVLVLYFHRRYRISQFAGSLLILISCVGSSLVPNPHWMFLTHTVINGVGTSLVLANVGLIISEYFNQSHKYHLLATTLVSGGPVATILFVSFYAFLIQNHNWRLAFLILGVIYFLVTASAAIFYTKNEAISKFTNTKMSCRCDQIKPKQVPLLILWFMDRVLTSVVTYGLALNLTDYVHRIQPNLVRSTILTTLFAFGEASTYIIGAIIAAITKDFFKEKLRYILLATAICMSAALVTLEFTKSSYAANKALCFITGFTLGPSNTFLFAAGEEFTRMPGHMAYPFTLGGMGVGMMMSPLLSAKIAELFKYKWFFFVLGCIIFIKCICLLLIVLLLLYYKNDPIYHASEPVPEPPPDPEDDIKETTKLLSDDRGK